MPKGAHLFVHGYSCKGAGVYYAWRNMRTRVNNPNYREYRHYGGRGITCCERWASFVNFLADMGEKPPGLTLERIDNDGNYEPGNCRWATPLEQSQNKRSNGEQKLTIEQVVAIRADTRFQRIIANEYGVSRTSISLIKAGINWRQPHANLP